MRLKRCFYLIMLLLVSMVIKISAQQNFGDLLAVQRESVFSESFDSNKNNWITDNQWILGKFDKGHYSITCKNFNENTGLTHLPVSIDQSKDFEIEASFTVISGSGALLFGLTTKDYGHYRIEIDDNRNLSIVKNIPSKGKIEKIFTGKGLTWVKEIGFYNKITVRKVLSSYYIFVNETLIKQIPNIIFSGDQMGFSVGLNSEISVDYLNVSYLKNQASPILAENMVQRANTEINPTLKDTLKANVQTLIQTGVTAAIPQPSLADGPVITWVMPTGITITNDSYTNTARVRVSIKSASEIKSALFYVNGASRGDGDIKPSGTEPGTFIAEKIISLNTGENEVYMVATGVDGLSNKSAKRYFVNPLASLPDIKWGVPSTTVAYVNTETIDLEVCIKSPADLLSVNVTVNGDIKQTAKVFQRMNNDTCNYLWKPKIILKEGENSIYVNAENVAGSNMSENRMITFSKAIAEKRIALIFGNSDYINGSSLKNPKNDANLMEATLKDLNFTVIKQINAPIDTMRKSIREFSKKLSAYNVALFYYAGHGIQVEGVNYLIPVNAKLETKEDCKWEAIPVAMVTDEFKRNSANTNIVILDACRNNPYKSWARGEEAGFKALGPINGTIISFATSEGATAADGVGDNGLFTEELVKQMQIPQSIESAFKNTRKEVMLRSNSVQMPVEWTYLTGDFYFKKK